MVAAEIPYHRLRAEASGRLDAMRERIERYVRAESPTGDRAALAACAELIEHTHRSLGRRPERDGEHLVTTWPGARSELAPLVVVGHYDTVWPVGQLATMPYVDDGETIAGPGTYDMKAALVAFETAMEILGELGIEPMREVRAVIIADEEIGSPDGRRVVERRAAGAAAVLGLEPPHPGGWFKTGRRGSTRLRIDVRGREAHAALDRSKGVSAIEELLDQLQAVRGALPADGETLVNIGRIDGGTRANVIAGEAWAELGLRFTSPVTEREVLDRLLALTAIRSDAEVVVRLLSNRPAWAAPNHNPLLDTVLAHSARLDQALGGRPAAGAGDTNFTGAAGVASLDGFGPDGAGAHAAHEHVTVAALPERTALLAAVIAAGALPPASNGDDSGDDSGDAADDRA